MQAIPLDTFFAYNANSGGKLLTIWINGYQYDARKSELKKITNKFTLQGSDKEYRVISHKKDYQVCSE